MLDTALAQIRFGVSMTFGRRFNIKNIHKLIEDIKATYKEFGGIGSEGSDILQGPQLDEETRLMIHERRMQYMAELVYENTEFYHNLFDKYGINPNEVTLDNLDQVPITHKKDIRDNPTGFINRKSSPSLQAFTTGTTGKPTAIWFSIYELELTAARGAISLALNATITPSDIVQINISSRATLGVYNTLRSARLIGAAVYPVGLIPPEETLALLVEEKELPGKKKKVSVMTTCPSYLGSLLEKGKELGYKAADFGLEKILCGGEILTDALRREASTFFEAEVLEGYAMTEIMPLTGWVCSQDHLHFEPNVGMIEILDPFTYKPVGKGEIGTLVVTPYFPYRDTTLLYRFDTEDIVRRIGCNVNCELSNLPATSKILGRLSFSVKSNAHFYFERDLLEVLEAIPQIPLPVRYYFTPQKGGFHLNILVREASQEVKTIITEKMKMAGLPLQSVSLYTSLENMEHTIPVRADLREETFTRL
jgi:phenylacetate-coenzyme A ligase PaaK-like adenylate-forming protein